MKDEREILERLQLGDEAAFNELVREHQKEVHMLALRILGDNEEALDVSQLVFIKAYKALKNFRGDSTISTWLYRITYNYCLKRINTVRWRRFVPLNEEVSSTPSPVDIQAETEAGDFKESVQQALKSLPSKQKAVFVMHHFQGLKFREIAEITGKKEGSVKALHFQAVNKLREALKEWKHAGASV